MRFLISESGAVTVDWVVLAAGVVGLGMASVASVRGGVGELSTDINVSVAGAEVANLRTERDQLMRAFFEARNASRVANGAEEISWHDHNVQHDYSDADLMARLEGYRINATRYDDLQVAIDAFASHGDASSLAGYYEAWGYTPEDAQSTAESILATRTPEEYTAFLQSNLDKRHARLAYYEYEAAARGLE